MSIYFQQYARPYATAAFEWAKETHHEQQWQDFLQGLALSFSDSSLRPLLFNPKLGAPRLAEVLSQILADNIDVHQQNFLKLIAQQRRFDLLPTIATLFDALLHAAQNCLMVEVRSAMNLSSADQARLIDKLSQKYNKQVQLTCHLEPRLIGGIQIKMGDEVIDASIRGKLEKLAVQLNAQ